MKALRIAAFVACGLLVSDCATDGAAAVGADVYGGFYYDDAWWYAGGGCCADYPGDIGPPPHPEHPIVKPDTPRPANPIANAPSRPASPSRPMPAPRASMSMSRGGGGRR